MVGNSFKQSKEMVFAWCKSGDHDKCRKQYGGDRIVCVCDCDAETHGKNYMPINKAMTENELNTSLASINAIMFGDAGDGASENRAVKSESPIWGDQVKEGNQAANANVYPKIGNAVSHFNETKVSGYNVGTPKSKYEWPEALDAENIEELEKRRSDRKLGSYDYSGFESWV